MIICDLSSCVLNKRGECMKTNRDECPYYVLVLKRVKDWVNFRKEKKDD